MEGTQIVFLDSIGYEPNQGAFCRMGSWFLLSLLNSYLFGIGYLIGLVGAYFMWIEFKDLKLVTTRTEVFSCPSPVSS